MLEKAGTQDKDWKMPRELAWFPRVGDTAGGVYGLCVLIGALTARNNIRLDNGAGLSDPSWLLPRL